MTKSVSSSSAFNPVSAIGQMPDMADVLTALMVVCSAGQTVQQVSGSRVLANHVREITKAVCPENTGPKPGSPQRRPTKGAAPD